MAGSGKSAVGYPFATSRLSTTRTIPASTRFKPGRHAHQILSFLRSISARSTAPLADPIFLLWEKSTYLMP